MSESIFPAAPHATRRDLLTQRASAGALYASSTVASAHDVLLLAILDAPLHDGEPAHLGFLRKETELRAAFAALPVPDARAIHARLANPQPGDTLATRFARLVADRRSRLLAFLADARRRAALAAAAGK